MSHDRDVAGVSDQVARPESTATKSTVRLEDLRGFLKTAGPSVSLEDLRKPVDLSAAIDNGSKSHDHT